MNNPFLSDRNIFSKVVNPLRKKPEGEREKKEGPAVEQYSRGDFNIAKSSEGIAKNSDIPLTSNYQSMKETNSLSSNLNSKQSIGKMSFGIPAEVET